MENVSAAFLRELSEEGVAISCGEEPWEVTHGPPRRCTLQAKPHLTQPRPAGSQSTSQFGLSILQNFFSNQN